MDVYVRSGDSFWSYSQLFRIPLQLIIDSNRNLDSDRLAIGQLVRIPGYAVQRREIRSGDSLWSIAMSRNLPLDTLILVNPDLNPNQLQIGQVVNVPTRVTWRIVNGRREYDYGMMKNDLQQLLAIYPFLQIAPIGNSVLGNEIPEVLIGRGDKKVHYNGSFHANEWITTAIIMTFLNDYALSLTNQSTLRGVVTSLLYEQTSLSIVPMVNPDGVELVLNGPPEGEPHRSNVLEWNDGSLDFSSWKANIDGVDLNDQFPAEWEKEREGNPRTPGPRDYGGESPLSQPESIAMAELTRRRDFARVLPFHTQGQVIYWGFEGCHPSENEVLAGEFGRVSGYTPEETTGSYAGYKDWFIQDWRRSGFTVELGIGTNPLPITQFDEMYEAALGICLAALYL